MTKLKKIPSPCIDVCKYRRAGHCIACSMTKPQKKLFKSLKNNDQRAAFVEMLQHQQRDLGKFGHWHPAYDRKCLKKGVKPPRLKAG
ncbi:MAG: DUF1289 domain-containing protein [Pseudomonadota bacterium]